MKKKLTGLYFDKDFNLVIENGIALRKIKKGEKLMRFRKLVEQDNAV